MAVANLDQSGGTQLPASLAERLGVVAAGAIESSCDVWMLLDSGGQVIAAGAPGLDLPDGFAESLPGRSVFDVLSSDSQSKAQSLLHQAQPRSGRIWRELNHVANNKSHEIAVRYSSQQLPDQTSLWIGRDLSQAAAMQGWMLQAQQDMEREQAQLRANLQTTQTVLAHIPQAVIVVDPGNRKVDQANQAAQRVAGRKVQIRAGEPVSRYFDRDSHDGLGDLISEAVLGHAANAELLLANGAGTIQVDAVAVRTARSTRVLMTLGQSRNNDNHSEGEPWTRVAQALPGALVVADRGLAINAVNPAFLDLSGFPSKAAALGTDLGDVLGRTGIEMSVLHANLREHGAVQNFSTILRTLSGRSTDVLISAVSLGVSDTQAYALLITPQPQSARAALPSPKARQKDNEAETDYTALIGRQSLKDIVRDTADLIERRCIERALEMTGNNRASAAELLGLSRQSLYTKLHRYGLASGEEDS